MTVDKLRELLQQVEAHGGPVRVMPESRFPGVQVEYGGDEIREEHHIESVLNLTSVAGSVCAALKRDLIERGCDWVHVRFAPNSGWVASITVRYEDEDTDHCIQGSSELEALLKVWLAAAQAEGWSP